MTSLPEEDWCFTAADGFVGKITVSKEFNSLPDEGRFIEPPEILDRITICVIKDKKGDVFVGKSVVIDGKDYDEGVECLKAKQDAKNSMGKRDHFTTNNGWEILGQPFYWEKYGIYVIAERYTEYGTLQYMVKGDGCEKYVGKILDNAMIFNEDHC